MSIFSDIGQVTALCLRDPVACARGTADVGYRLGRQGAGGTYEGASAGADLANLSAQASGRSAGLVGSIVQTAQGVSDAATGPLDRVESIARWVGIGIIAIAVILAILAAIYFGSPIVSALRGL